MARRVFVEQPRLGSERVEDLVATVDRAFKYVRRLDVLSLEDAVLALSVSKRRRYVEAAASIQQRPFDARDARVSLFVKADKLTGVGAEEKKPRAIQGRTPRFNVWIARYLKPIERRLCHFLGEARGVKRTRVFAKGLDNYGRAELIVAKAAEFANPVVVSLDASSFDASVGVTHLRCVHSIYEKCFPNNKEFRDLLKMQLNNVGVGSSGVKYHIRGNRMSGDVDTGMGNSLLNYVLVSTCARFMGIKKWDMLCDGDDALFFVEAGDCDFAQMCRVMLTYGFSLTGNEVRLDHHNYWDIEFCRSRPIRLDDGRWVLCRDPWRAVANFGVTNRFALVPPETYRRYLKGSAMCELFVSSELPMIGPLAWEVYNAVSGKAILDVEVRWRQGILIDKDLLKRRQYACPRVSWSVRRQVELAYGYTPAEQMQYESSCHDRVSRLWLPDEHVVDAVVAEVGGSRIYHWLH